jgi:hypothetical protein
MASYKRPSGYTEELGERICEELLQGHSVLAVSRLEGMPSHKTIRRWGYKAENSNEAFVSNYARARAEGAHTEFDKIRDLEQDLLTGKLDPQTGRVVIDSIKWRLSKMLPRSYGDHQTIEHQGEIKTRPVDHCPEWISERLEQRISSAAQQEDDEEGAE